MTLSFIEQHLIDTEICVRSGSCQRSTISHDEASVDDVRHPAPKGGFENGGGP